MKNTDFLFSNKNNSFSVPNKNYKINEFISHLLSKDKLPDNEAIYFLELFSISFNMKLSGEFDLNNLNHEEEVDYYENDNNNKNNLEIKKENEKDKDINEII